MTFSFVFRRRASLCESLESLECIIDEDPVFEHLAVLRWTRRRGCMRIIKIRPVISTETAFCINLRISRATSGKSSKLDVSSIERTSTGIAAGRSLICSQSTPRKKGILLTSSMPFCDPRRRSASQQNLIIVSFASSDMGVSGGKMSVSRQFITFR